MGIRPRFYIIVGFNSKKKIRGPSLKSYEDKVTPFTDEGIKDKLPDGKFLEDVVYNPSGEGEFCVRNLVGFITQKGKYDDDFIRALVSGVSHKFINTHAWVIPTLKPEEHYILFNYSGYTPEDVECNRFVDSTFESSPAYSRLLWKKAIFYLAQAGWTVTPQELHYFLVVNWE